jgi:hypothetical protein
LALLAGWILLLLAYQIPFVACQTLSSRFESMPQEV